MKKKHFFFAIVICVGLFTTFLMGASASENSSIYKLMGEYFKEAREEDSAGVTVADESLPLAEFHGEKIYQADVEYYNNINNLSSAEVTNTQTTQETLTEILQNVVLFEEAERLGYTATQTEINAMVDNAKLAYSLPEGKVLIEQYCEGANITVDEYFEYLKVQAPRVIARQKLLNAVGMKFCEENELTFTKINPPEELVKAQEAYIADLFAQAESEIIYHIDVN